MKERSRKQNFLKNVGLVPNKNPRPVDQEDEVMICERLCFYHFEDNGQVICRSCYKSFDTWLNYRMHFNVLCSISDTNYKLNTYNEVYKKYKLKKAKTNKKINDRLISAQLMDPETLNTRKTRKRCYTNARVAVNSSKSSSDSSPPSSEKTISVKRVKKEALETDILSNESVEVKPETFDCKTVQNIPVSLNTNVPNLPHDNQSETTIKMEWKASDVSQVSSGNQSSNYLPKYKPKEDKTIYQYVCVVCDERFINKCLLTMHQVQHIKSDRSCYGVLMAALTRSS